MVLYYFKTLLIHFLLDHMARISSINAGQAVVSFLSQSSLFLVLNKVPKKEGKDICIIKLRLSLHGFQTASRGLVECIGVNGSLWNSS